MVFVRLNVSRVISGDIIPKQMKVFKFCQHFKCLLNIAYKYPSIYMIKYFISTTYH